MAADREKIIAYEKSNYFIFEVCTVQKIRINNDGLFVAVVAYQLCLKMGDVLGEGTEGNVFIQLIGDKGLTEQIQLRQAGNSKIRFEKGRTYKFTVETVDIGKVRFQCFISLSVCCFVVPLS